jgi:hypothetical protein
VLDSIHLSLDLFVDDGERSTDEAPNSAHTPAPGESTRSPRWRLSAPLTPATAVAVLVTKENRSSWIFEPCLTWANAIQRVQRSAFSLGSYDLWATPSTPPAAWSATASPAASR